MYHIYKTKGEYVHETTIACSNRTWTIYMTAAAVVLCFRRQKTQWTTDGQLLTTKIVKTLKYGLIFSFQKQTYCMQYSYIEVEWIWKKNYIQKANEHNIYQYIHMNSQRTRNKRAAGHVHNKAKNLGPREHNNNNIARDTHVVDVRT